MIKYNKNSEISAISNVRGKYIINPHSMPFSFYFSSGANISHDIRVKPSFNPERLRLSQTGTLKLSDDWEYIPGPDDKKIDQQSIKEMKSFFRDYLVLFCAVWEEQIDEGDVEDYFLGRIDLKNLIKQFDFYQNYSEDLDLITSVRSLELFCRINDIVNMHGN